MEKDNLYIQLVNVLRKEYPILSFDNVSRNIEKSIEQFGIKVKYSDMTHLKTRKEIDSYVHVIHVIDGTPQIIVNGLQNYQKQRFTIAQDLGHALIYWKWRPDRLIEENLVKVFYHNEKENSDNFADKFLAPLDKVIDSVNQIENDDSQVQISKTASTFAIPHTIAYRRWKKTKNKNKTCF